MAEHIVHEHSNSGLNALIAALIVLAVVILGVFLFRNGFPTGGTRDANIRVELPTGENQGGIPGTDGGGGGQGQY